MLETGLIGLLAWISFWYKVGKRSVTSLLRDRNTVVPVLLFLFVLLKVAQGQILGSKLGLVIYAYILIIYVLRRPQLYGTN
jgi:hypothetical protein